MSKVSAVWPNKRQTVHQLEVRPSSSTKFVNTSHYREPSFFEPGSISRLASPGARGIPRPGDMVVWYISWDPFVGHIAVVVNVRLPSIGHLGSLIFAEANGPTPLYTMTINPDFTVNAWPGYYVAGYVRSVGATNTT